MTIGGLTGKTRDLDLPEFQSAMTYIVTDACIKCKFMDCVEVCPVDCFYEGENFLAINPDECIDWLTARMKRKTGAMMKAVSPRCSKPESGSIDFKERPHVRKT